MSTLSKRVLVVILLAVLIVVLHQLIKELGFFSPKTPFPPINGVVISQSHPPNPQSQAPLPQSPLPLPQFSPRKVSVNSDACYNADGIWEQYRTMSHNPYVAAGYNEKTPVRFYHRDICRDIAIVPKSLTWKWTAEKCPDFPTYETFQDTFSFFVNKTLFFLGDSISQEQFYSLVYLFEGKMRDPPTQCREEVPVNTVTQKIGEIECFKFKSHHVTLLYFRRDRFFDVQGMPPNLTFPGSSFFKDLGADFQALAIDVLIVNVGAHTASPSYVWKYEYISKVFLQEIRQHYSGHLIFRNSMPGHPGCENFSSPELNFFNKSHDDKYGWQTFGIMNQFWNSTIHNYSDPKIHILQADKITRDRPDGHTNPGKDCLHYCLPGSLDTLNFQLAMLMKTLSF